MTVTEIRLRILELSRPHGISLPDVEMWIKRARQIEEYVTDAADTPTEAPQKRRGRPPKPARITRLCRSRTDRL